MNTTSTTLATMTRYRTVTILAACAFLGACVTTQHVGQQGAVDDPCNVGQSAVAGAALGALLGVITDGSPDAAVRGAAIGAGAGAIACYVMRLNSRQTKTAAQAQKDFLRTNARLPSQPKVVMYSPQLSSAVTQRGKPFYVTSTLELIDGSAAKVNEVREELVIFSPDGTPFRAGGKPFTATSAGRFENSFELTLPQSAPQGKYRLQTKVYVNGNQMASRDLGTQVVWDGTSALIVASR